jgi:cell wall-associated NlpC family hydrolase
MDGGMRRVLLLVTALIAVAAPPAEASRSWAAPQISYVVKHGLVPGITVPAAFQPQQPLDAGTLSGLLSGVVPAAPRTTADPTAPRTVFALDTAFVNARGLRDVTRGVENGLVAAGLAPRPSAGTEVVAATLGFRSVADPVPPWPATAATRAEAAYTAWKVLTEKGWEPDYVRSKLAKLQIPPVTGAALAPLRLAVSEIGAPYLWGGASPQDGGFDCSGLVVYVEHAAPWLGGRTTMQMARSTLAQHVPVSALQAGDVVLFGPHGPKTLPSQIGHAGLVLGGGWFIHSSSAGVGVTLERLDASWVVPQIAFGLRPPPGP